jgi:hypothetical protein
LPRYERSIVHETPSPASVAEAIDSSLISNCACLLAHLKASVAKCVRKASRSCRTVAGRKFCALEQVCMRGLVAIAMAGQQRCLDAWRKAVVCGASPWSTKPIAGRHQYRMFGRFCAMQHRGRVAWREVGHPLPRTCLSRYFVAHAIEPDIAKLICREC